MRASSPTQQKNIEGELLSLLEDPDPSNYDRACNIFAELAMSHWDCLVRYVDSYTSNLSFDSESLVNDIILTELNKITERFKDPSKGQNYSFCKKHNISFKGYLINCIGKLHSGKRSGKITSEVKKEIRRIKIIDKLSTFEIKSDDVPYAACDPLENLQLERVLYIIRDAIKSLLPQEQFIIKIHYNFDIDPPFTPTDIQKVAIKCGYEKLAAAKIRARFQRISSINLPVRCLTQENLASVLDLNSTRQLRRIRKRAVEKIKRWIEDNFGFNYLPNLVS